jgi:asparagine synthase (glutamine-hydrolysing)
MCAIAGYFGFNDESLLKKFSKQLAHRGPDGEGYFFDDNIGLLNRRLAIIDLKSGDQPIYNEDESVVVVYNGEIYNYGQLRSLLEKKGHKFKTLSDTEVIVHLYEEEAERCFNCLNGMFAVALYDIKKKKLVLARDHFGIKPLYYAIIPKTCEVLSLSNLSSLAGFNIAKTSAVNETNKKTAEVKNQLIFASEIKPLFYSGLIEKKPNDRIIYRYLRFRVHDDNEETFFSGIKKLMPGELLIVQGSRFKVQRYTNLKEELLESVETCHGKSLQKKDIECFKEKLIEAVKLRLISDVPVGTCLSGGLDSSTVVSVINKLLMEKVKEARSIGKIQNTFSAVFPGSSNNEERYVDKLIKNVRTAHWAVRTYKIYPKPEGFFAEIEDFIRTQEEPTVSTGPYAQYKIMQAAAKHVKALLDGQGADEMMAGYLPYYFIYLREVWRETKAVKLLRLIWKARDVFLSFLGKELLRILKGEKIVNPSDLIDKEFIDKFKNERFKTIDDNLKKRLIEDIFYNSLPALLRYEDRNSMRFSVEGRVPFLDFNLIKYLFSLSDEAIIKDGWNKFILREGVRDLIPEAISKRRSKIGFTTPEHDWFLRMKNRIYTIFLSDSFAKRPYFNQQKVLKAFQEFIEGKNNETMLFWRLLNLELWLRFFFDSESENVGTAQWAVRTEKKLEFSPNEGKKLEIEIEGKSYLRLPLKTDLFKKGDVVAQKIAEHTLHYYINILKSNSKYNKLLQRKWWIVVSEKIIAITQGRSYFIWEIKPGFWAKFLCQQVTKTPWGIGLGSPWTMELAINEVGLWRILLAAFVAFITKPFGIRGLFYRIVGKEIAAIDGPTEYSLYPSNVSAKLGPKEPEKVAKQIHQEIISNFKFLTHEPVRRRRTVQGREAISDLLHGFLGVVIIDANDLGQKVLANSTNLDNSLIEKIFKDNPMGQADEQTPIVVVIS